MKTNQSPARTVYRAIAGCKNSMRRGNFANIDPLATSKAIGEVIEMLNCGLLTAVESLDAMAVIRAKKI